jgi:flavin reductase (DIM6/NTAB) family NADH-FMN oxidoreductase RutF
MNAEPRHEIDPDRFRRVMGRFATGVTVITATADGVTRGMTANAFMSGSLDPPLCVVSVAKRAHMHDHLIAAGRFAVNMLAAGQENIAIHFAGRPVPGLKLSLADVDGVPVIAGAVAVITALTAARHDCGDHTIFIGHIATMDANDRPPLLYHASRFAALIPLREEAPAMPEFW